MGRKPKFVNEHYFERESKSMWYVLGAFYRYGTLFDDMGIMFKAPSLDLVQIVKRELSSEHAIIEDNRDKSSYWLMMKSAPHLYDELQVMGVKRDESRRRLPKMQPEYASHFVRGFLEYKTSPRIGERNDRIDITYNNIFLVGLNHLLARHAGTKRADPEDDSIDYWHKDSLKIKRFMYRDWEDVKKYGIYIPSMKREYDENYTEAQRRSIARLDVIRRVETAKELLQSGMPDHEVARVVGYNNVYAFDRAFSKVVGCRVVEWPGKQAKEVV